MASRLGAAYRGSEAQAAQIAAVRLCRIWLTVISGKPGKQFTTHELAVVAMKVVHPGESGQAVGCDSHRPSQRIARMNIDKNARLTPPGRLLLVQRIEGGG